MNRKHAIISEEAVVRVELLLSRPIPVAVRSKALVYSRSLAGTEGSNPTRYMDVCLLSVVCCQAQVSATGRSLVQRSPTDCGVPECDRAARPATGRKTTTITNINISMGYIVQHN
jgi:hypothetical protein